MRRGAGRVSRGRVRPRRVDRVRRQHLPEEGACLGTLCHANAHTYTNTDAYTQRIPNTLANVYANANGDTNSYSLADGLQHPHEYAGRNAYSNTHAQQHAHLDRHAVAFAYTYAAGIPNRDATGACHRNGDCTARRGPDEHTNAYAGGGHRPGCARPRIQER